ncbi:MAG: beta-eliminating lyase-related protein [Gemmataceae bacterium]|nr:beta-eliminating lyase-related protein [Gemmataceae bacterium]MCI0739032.1 beta-eliminating lyase-related protein [Gemmataceae bacterium]
MHNLIDLRSDTVTRPTPAMRAAMAQADVGDDVFSEDPTVNRLEERVADYLGKEAALFVPSGTMSNQIGVKAHTQPGDELLCEAHCHIYNNEAGGPAVHSGVTCRTFEGDFGILDLSQLQDKIRNINDSHQVRTRLVCLENTHNYGGGRVYPIDMIEAISRWARAHGLAMHLDGARLWNAIVATGIAGPDWAKHFDTVSVCFSKGLGAPLGSALAGSRDLIAKGRRIRKLFGGGMRQAGVVAAAALYAMEHHIDRLADDHRNAQTIAKAVAESSCLTLQPSEVHTNLIWFHVDPAWGTAKQFAEGLKEMGVSVFCFGPHRIRACTHLDVSAAQAERAAEAVRQVARLRPKR